MPTRVSSSINQLHKSEWLSTLQTLGPCHPDSCLDMQPKQSSYLPLMQHRHKAHDQCNTEVDTMLLLFVLMRMVYGMLCIGTRKGRLTQHVAFPDLSIKTNSNPTSFQNCYKGFQTPGTSSRQAWHSNTVLDHQTHQSTTSTPSTGLPVTGDLLACHASSTCIAACVYPTAKTVPCRLTSKPNTRWACMAT